MIAGRETLESMSAACGWAVRFFSRFDSWRCTPVATPSSGHPRKTPGGPEVSESVVWDCTLAFGIIGAFCANAGVLESARTQRDIRAFMECKFAGVVQASAITWRHL